jgi:photosystem II stability/assembly factor-like uncharacterized protein
MHLQWSAGSRRTLLFLIAATATYGQTPQPPKWVPIGPHGASVHRVIVDQANPSRMYALSGSRIFRTTNAGQSWSSIAAGLSSLEVRSLLINPLSPSTLFAAFNNWPGSTAWSGELFRSDDYGENWVQVSSPEYPLYDLAIDPQVPTTLYAASSPESTPWRNPMVYRSTDAGETWTAGNLVHDGKDPVEIVLVDRHTPSTVFAAATGVVFRSTDRGENWTAISSNLPRVRIESLIQDPQTPTTLYIGANEVASGGVYRSVDGGVTWDHLGLGPTFSVAVDPVNPLKIYAGTFFSGVLMSLDGGATWSSKNNGLQNLRVRSLAIHPQASSTVYAGNGNGVIRTDNSGESWTPIVAGMNGLFVMQIAVNPQAPSTLFAAMGVGGVFRSTDAGESWQRLDLSGALFRSVAIDPQTPSTVYAVNYQGGGGWSLSQHRFGRDVDPHQ